MMRLSLAALLAVTLLFCLPQDADPQTATPTGLASLNPATSYSTTDTFALCQNGTNSCSLANYAWSIGSLGALSTFLAATADAYAHNLTGQISQGADCPLTDTALPGEIAVNAAACGASGSDSPSTMTITPTGEANGGVQPHMIGCPSNPKVGQLLRFWASQGSTVYNLSWDQRCWQFGGGPHGAATPTGGTQPDFGAFGNPSQSALIVCDTLSTSGNGTFRCSSPGQSSWNFGPFTPLWSPNTVSYVDASVSASVFSGTTCSGPTVTATSSGATIGSVLDLSGNGFCWQPVSMTYKTDASGNPAFYSLGNGHFTCATGPGGGGCGTVGENASSIVATFGALLPADTANQAFVAIMTNGTTTAPRYWAGWGLGGATGEGPAVAARAPDSGTTGIESEGTVSGWVNTPIVANVNMVYAQQTGYLQIDNGTPVFGGGLTANAVSDSTSNGAFYLGFNGTSGLPAGTYFYGEALRIYPTGSPDIFEQNQVSTMFCTREGLNSGAGC